MNERIYQASDLLSPEEFDEFCCETKNIHWEPFLKNYVKGMGIWALMEDHISPEHGLEQILLKNYNRFDNFKDSFLGRRQNFMEKDLQKYEGVIVNKKRYYDFL